MPSVSRRYAGNAGRFERPSSHRDEALRAPVILMVSGGADSTALLVLAATSTLNIDDGRGDARIAKERLHVLHINHQLRGLDAEEDEEFVCELAKRYGIPITVKHFDVAGIAEKIPAGNVENVGRELRYQAATELANELSDLFQTPRSAARIVTAHNANDRAETFFMNAIKGSGSSGLASIPRRRNRIVRPLLDRTHEELCEFLRMKQIVWREDATNADTSYLRSFVRHEVLPVCKSRNPNMMASLASTCDILSDEDAYLTAVSARVKRELTRRSTKTAIALDASRLAATELAIARRVIRQAMLELEPDGRFEARHIAAVLSMVAAATGSQSLPHGLDARVEHGVLILRTRASLGEAIPDWLNIPGTLMFGPYKLSASCVSLEHGAHAINLARAHGAEHEGRAVLIDAEAAHITETDGKLWVDSIHPGDVMCPFGMHGQSKKLSDLLNEADIPLAERPSVPVVRTSATGAVVWVAGIRLDERVKVQASSKRLVELSIAIPDEDLAERKLV